MVGYAMKKDDVLARLRRIEGQVRGIARMVEADSYCIDVLTQVSAAQAALNGVSLGLLDDHVRNCVRESFEAGDPDAKIEELVRAVSRLVGRR
jgi:DNA-binding FrmR family transcriptional regulator